RRYLRVRIFIQLVGDFAEVVTAEPRRNFTPPVVRDASISDALAAARFFDYVRAAGNRRLQLEVAERDLLAVVLETPFRRKHRQAARHENEIATAPRKLEAYCLRIEYLGVGDFGKIRLKTRAGALVAQCVERVLHIARSDRIAVGKAGS